MNYVAGWIICDDTEFAINFNSVNARSGSTTAIGNSVLLMDGSGQ